MSVRVRLVAAVAVAIAVPLAGCGGNADEPGVATAASGGAQPTSSTTAQASVIAEYVAAVRGYVTCMREAGINLPDPGPKGEIDFSALGDAGTLKRDPKFVAAGEKCKNLLPPVPEELQDKGPPLTAEQIGYAREYAKCMRANGVPDFPDPGPDGRSSGWPTGQITEQQAAAAFRAGQICEPVLGGRPPTTPNPNATGVG